MAKLRVNETLNGVRDAGLYMSEQDYKDVLEATMCVAHLHKDSMDDFKNLSERARGLLNRLGEIMFDGMNDDPEVFIGSMRVHLLSQLFAYRWSHSNRVFMLDKDFAEALLATDGISLSRYSYEHLPWDTFVLQFEGTPLEGQFDDIEWVACYAAPTNQLFFNLCSRRGIECVMVPIKGGDAPEDIVVDNLDSMYGADCAGVVFGEAEDGSLREAVHPTKFPDGSVNAIMIMLQLMNYFTSEDKDIVARVQTAKSRSVDKKGQVRTTRVEECICKVGYTVGASIRAFNTVQAGTVDSNSKGSKKRPHMRRAHWHHFWTGKGRTIYSVRWVSPMLIHGDEKGVITVHKS